MKEAATVHEEYGDAVNPNEKIVTVREIVEGQETVFYAIRDVKLDYWRSDSPIDDPDAAWTRIRKARAEFANYFEAEDEMISIWEYRSKAA